jgi:hypothetical protein
MHLTTTAAPANNQTRTAAMYSYISQFFGGTLDPTWPHAVLIAGSIVGGALVGLGVILEAPKIFSVPVAAVFVGVVIEAACTLALFGFDEGISGAQQSKIIALETRIAPRVLTTAQCQGIVDSLGPFAGKKVRVTTYVADGEGSTLGQMIEVCLIAAKMDVQSALASLLPWNGFFAGIAVSGADKELVETLRSALATKGNLSVLPITGAFPGNEYRGPSSPEALPAMIVVGVKPAEKPKFE